MSKVSKIKVGAKVKIAKTSEYYGYYGTGNNPRDVIGTVTENDRDSSRGFIYSVAWSNGTTNQYKLGDLELVVDEKPKRSDWFPKALELHKQGKKSKAIAKELGVPDRTVRHNIQKYFESELQSSLKEVEPVLEPIQAHDKPLRKAPELPNYIVQGKRPTIFIIPDTQCKQGVDLAYMHHIGNYIKLKRPDIIVHLGDHYDMASLSTYDKGKLSAENKRYKADIEAGDEGIRILESYIQSIPNYKPRKVVTLGNHEDRIDRFVQDNPNFEGLIGTDKLAFDDYGWEVYPFLTPVNICGINFVHYLQNTMTGKPLGGTALNRLKSVGESFVMGHVQTYDFCQRPLPLTGKHQIGLIVGACYEHDEDYKGVQGNHHFRGCVMLYECADGYAMHKAITLRHMRELFERGTV